MNVPYYVYGIIGTKIQGAKVLYLSSYFLTRESEQKPEFKAFG